MRHIQVFLAMILGNFGPVLSQTCPPLEDITPCNCYGKHHSLNIYCSEIPLLRELQTAIHGMRGITFDSFTIKDSTLGYIPCDIFQNVRMRHLFIIKSNFNRIGNLGDPQFQGLEDSLESLTLWEVYSKSDPLAYVSLGHLKKLHTFDFRKGYAGLLSNHWFKDGPRSLKELRFVEAHIKNIGYKALQALINLQILDLSQNNINYLSRTMIPNPALYLEEINLERNKLESFEENIFSGMPSLKRINLELNEISTIDETIWKPVWSHLQFVNIDYNPMFCDKRIRWIFYDSIRLQEMLVGTCYKPFNLMDRDFYDLKIEELK